MNTLRVDGEISISIRKEKAADSKISGHKRTGPEKITFNLGVGMAARVRFRPSTIYGLSLLFVVITIYNLLIKIAFKRLPILNATF